MSPDIFRGICSEKDSDLVLNVYFRPISVSPLCHFIRACEDMIVHCFRFSTFPNAMPATTTMINIDAAILEVESTP